ncbi:MAG TPA: hypothetical protein VHS56_01330 [Candidatus Cybelea sp.]|nr:hypothetical protein [Candidatus Cybelea sp.]
MRGVESVHRGPTVLPITNVRGNALFACDADEKWNESVIAVAVYGGRKSQSRRANTARSHLESRFFGYSRPCRAPSRIGRILFGHDAAGRNQRRAGRNEQMAVGCPERFTQRHNCKPVGFGRSRNIREIVNESGVDDGLSCTRSPAQTVEVLKRTSLDLGAGDDKRLGSIIRAGETENSMARADQFPDDGGADKAGRSRNEDTHKTKFLFGEAPVPEHPRLR